MIANDSFKYIALYVNCSLCYVTKVKGEWLPRTKNTLTTMPQDKKPQKSKDGKALDITHARHSQHVQLKVSLNLMFFRWDWSWTTTQITFMTDTLCTLLLIRLILFLYIFLQLLPFSWNDWANKILTNIWRTIHLPLQKYTFNMPNY